MGPLLIGLDLALCFVIAVAALDYIRAVYFVDEPLVSLAFYMVAIGAFGYGCTLLMAGTPPSPWSVLIHLGIVTYAGAHYSNIFEQQWRWDGKDRREGRGNRP